MMMGNNSRNIMPLFVIVIQNFLFLLPDVFVVIADSRKRSNRLGTKFQFVPVEVLPMAYRPVTEAIQV